MKMMELWCFLGHFCKPLNLTIISTNLIRIISAFQFIYLHHNTPQLITGSLVQGQVLFRWLLLHCIFFMIKYSTTLQMKNTIHVYCIIYWLFSWPRDKLRSAFDPLNLSWGICPLYKSRSTSEVLVCQFFKNFQANNMIKISQNQNPSC